MTKLEELKAATATKAALYVELKAAYAAADAGYDAANAAAYATYVAACDAYAVAEAAYDAANDADGAYLEELKKQEAANDLASIKCL